MKEKPEDPSKKYLRVEHVSSGPVVTREDNLEDIPDLTIDQLMAMTDIPDDQKLEILYGAFAGAQGIDSKKELLVNIIKLEKDKTKLEQMQWSLRQLVSR